MSVTTRKAPRRPATRYGLAYDLRTIRTVFRREAIRFANDQKRAMSVLLQSVLWLFVMGAGLSALTPTVTDTVDMRTFLFPGVIAMSVIQTSMSSAASVVWDREFGFLREMLVAPVRRGSIVIGKVLGGAVLATAEGVVLLAMAGLVGVPYHPLLLLALLGGMFLAAFLVTAFGVMVAARIGGMESFLGVMQLAIMPLMFMSGALFPVARLPGWLAALTTVNPLTYAVDPLRRAVFAFVDAPPDLAALYNPGISWAGWAVPVWVELLLVGGAATVFLWLAVVQFNRVD
ncbi:ABC transporter permease [Nonomuraea sp. B19D2]|uniref:ABC transporter permease n=1 Tax=Nonomuraea sp. B19D2 TaxID=3159561 RepID=UPI0032DB05AB